jgi:hypothetical protein
MNYQFLNLFYKVEFGFGPKTSFHPCVMFCQHKIPKNIRVWEAFISNIETEPMISNSITLGVGLYMSFRWKSNVLWSVWITPLSRFVHGWICISEHKVCKYLDSLNSNLGRNHYFKTHGVWDKVQISQVIPYIKSCHQVFFLQFFWDVEDSIWKESNYL